MRSVIIIPALNEEAAIGGVVEAVRDRSDRVIVVDNGSTDQTAERARAAGADVIHVARPGYGRACLAGVSAAADADLIIFMDGDGRRRSRRPDGFDRPPSSRDTRISWSGRAYWDRPSPVR